MKAIDMQHKILNLAEELIQTKGYNAFSYRDIASGIGIKTSSIHYYFPAKSDLGTAVVRKHLNELYSQLETVMHNAHLSSAKKLDLFFDSIFAKTFYANRKMCLAGMLAADALTLSQDIQSEVKLFFKRIENWLEEILSQGVKKQEFFVDNTIKEEVQLIIAILEGTLLLARLYDDESRLKISRKLIKARLTKV